MSRGLNLFRSALGLVCLIHLLSLLGVTSWFWGSTPLVSAEMLNTDYHWSSYFSGFHSTLMDSEVLGWAIWFAAVFSAVCFTFQKSIPLSGAVLLVLTYLMFGPSHPFELPGFRLLVFPLLIFVLFPDERNINVSFILKLNLVLLYASSVLSKLSFPDWQGGTAMNFVLMWHQGQTWWKTLILEWHLERVLTYAVLLMEVAIPLLLLNRRTRKLGIVIGLLFHIPMGIIMGMPFFQFAVLIHYLLFLTNGNKSKVQTESFGFSSIPIFSFISKSGR